MDEENSDGSWGGLLSTVKDIGSAAADAYGSLNNNAAVPAAGTTAATNTPVDFSKFMPIAILGAVVLLVVLFFRK